MKEKYFEIVLADYDNNGAPLCVETVYCRASKRINEEEAKKFCRDSLGINHNGAFYVNEITCEDARNFTGDNGNIPSFEESLKPVSPQNTCARPVWKIPVTYSMCGFVEVEADTLEDAMDVARDKDGVIPLPENADYVDGSWELSETDVDFVRECYNNNRQDPI